MKRTWTYPELVVKLVFIAMMATGAYYGFYLFFSIVFGRYAK